jgi:hypothetical protein
VAWIRQATTLGKNNYLGFLALIVGSRIKLMYLLLALSFVL